MTGYVVTATIPQLDGVSTVTWKEGTTFSLDLKGSGFINQGETYDALTGQTTQTTFMPTVQLIDDGDQITILQPDAADVGFISVTIPENLMHGNYQVQINKNGKLSNPIGITIVPAIYISVALCYQEYNIILIRGDNLSVHFPIEPAVTGITGDGAEPDRIYRWRYGMIAALFMNGCPSTVTVRNVFDSVTITDIQMR